MSSASRDKGVAVSQAADSATVVLPTPVIHPGTSCAATADYTVLETFTLVRPRSDGHFD
jgi:hypothetical protein